MVEINIWNLIFIPGGEKKAQKETNKNNKTMINTEVGW